MSQVVEMASRRPSQIMRNIEHPIDAIHSCKVSITRTVEGIAVATCLFASGLLPYFIFKPDAEPILCTVDVVLIGASGAAAYFAHKTVGSLSLQTQIGSLSRNNNALSVEVDRFALSHAKLERIAEEIQSLHIDFRVAEEDINEDDELDRTAQLFTLIRGKIQTHMIAIECYMGNIERYLEGSTTQDEEFVECDEVPPT